jgi:hypothetical protein
VGKVTNGTYPARLGLNAPLEVKNWRPLVNWLLAIPHYIVAAALAALRRVLTLVAFFTILFTRQIPRSIFDMIVMTRRYSWRAVSYGLWMRESYPPFSFTLSSEDDGIDPAWLSVDYPENLNRWAPLYKWLLAIPHIIVLIFLGLGVVFVILASFFVVLFTGKWPESFRSFVIGIQGWSLRVGAYVLFLRDEYPPFSLQDGSAMAGPSGTGGQPAGAVPPSPPLAPEAPAVPPPPA